MSSRCAGDNRVIQINQSVSMMTQHVITWCLHACMRRQQCLTNNSRVQLYCTQQQIYRARCNKHKCCMHPAVL